MNNKKTFKLFLLISLLELVLIIFLLYKEKFFSIYEENSDKSTTSYKSGSFVASKFQKESSIKEKKKYSIKEIDELLTGFSYIFNDIKEEYNLAKLLLDEFDKVNSFKSFIQFEHKFTNNLVLFTSLKVHKKKYYLKYFRFYLGNKKYEKFKKDIEKIYDNYLTKGYIDLNKYLNNKGDKDYFLLSLSNLSLKKKIGLCKNWYNNDKDNYISCKRFVYYMASNNKNNLCDKLDTDYYKKWCFDTLKLLKNDK